MQTNYGYSTAPGVPGGFFDLALHDVVERNNGEDTGKMKFGLGVVQGATPGVDVKLPVSTDTASKFEGITVYTANTEMDLDGKIRLVKGGSLSILNHGKIWVQAASTATEGVKYGETAFLITDGDEAGCFTDNADTATKVKVKGRFITTVKDGLVGLELFDSANA